MPSKLRHWGPAAILLIAGSAQSIAGGQFDPEFDLSSLDGTNGFVCNGVEFGDSSGWCISGAGDINGDGADDLIIGARFANPNGLESAGKTFVVFGGRGVGASGTVELSSLDGTNGFVIDGQGLRDSSGWSVSDAGDVNGDGFDDIIIGIRYPLAANWRDPDGESYVIFGGPGVGASGSIEFSDLDGTNGFQLNGIEAYDFSGHVVSTAGDMNGDGFDDLIIGTYMASPMLQVNSGSAYIVFGANDVGASGSIEFTELDGTNGFVCNGISFGDHAGASVAAAGDVNGDGFDDVIFGAPRADAEQWDGAGVSYVIFGSDIVGSGGVIDLTTLDGTIGFACNGIEINDRSGRAVSGAGDVNGDGFDDLIIAAYRAGPIVLSSYGETYVVFGSHGVGASGTLELADLDGTNGFVCNGIERGSRSGWSVSGAGDTNGDGFDDIIIGAPYDNQYGQFESLTTGASYVVFGGAWVGLGGTIELASLNGSRGFVCNGIDYGDRNGWSVSGAGDINGDGFNDIFIGAMLADPNGVGYAGESYVIFGRGDTIPADINKDGIVDTADLGILIDQFGKTAP